jgi:hypothetical protein
VAQRFTAAITGIFSMSASAAEGHPIPTFEFLRILFSRAAQTTCN